MNPFTLPQDTHIGGVHLQIPNLNRSLDFYSQLLGFNVINRTDRTVALSATGQPPEHILLTERPGARPKPRAASGLYHVAIRLPDRRSLARLFIHLQDHNYPVLGFSDHKVSEALYMVDPDGNGLELYTDRSEELWPRLDDQVVMTTDPLDIVSLMREADDSPWTGIDPRTDIGHVHLQVSDLGEAEKFYHNLIGLDITQRSYPGALFFSAGGYHHHLGTNIWAGQGVPPAPDDSIGLLSFSIHIPDISRWQALIKRLESGGVQIERLIQDENSPHALVRDPFQIGVDLVTD